MTRTGLKPVPLEKVANVLKAERRGTFDVYAPLSKVKIDVVDPLAESPLDRYQILLRDANCPRPARLSENSLKQIATLLGIQASLLEQLPASMGLKMVRYLLEKVREENNDRSFLFRLQEDNKLKLRAVLPSAFVRFDDQQLYSQIVGAFAEVQAKVTNLKVTDDLCALRIVSTKELNLGSGRFHDPAYPGIDILSSETGACPLTVRVVLFRLVCSNGITAIASSQDMLRVRNTRLKPDQFGDALTSALAESDHFSQRLAGGLRQAQGSYAKDPLKEVETIFLEYGLGSPRGRHARWVVDEVLKHHSLWGVSHFDLIQSITQVSQKLDHAKRLQWDDAAGAYLMSIMGRN